MSSPDHTEVPPYRPDELEPAAQRAWARDDAYLAVEGEGGEPFYCLSMLPYPSGALHMGHVRNYTITDVIARYQRMRGRNVMQPMGWDAFGLPAENAAIKHDTAPAKWTYQNIDHMRGQFQRLGFAFDWSRELTTCKPEYYRWEQWVFTQLMERGLAYRRDAEVNWDPVDQTVLANEQVVDGRGWRSGALVERRSIPQWFLKITDYAQQLLDGLDTLEEWPEAVKTMQRNWIGRSEGVEFSLAVCDEAGELAEDTAGIRVFTTRPDTAFGMTYAVLAPEHPMVDMLTAPSQRDEVAQFRARLADIDETERTADGGDAASRGVALGAWLLNPFNGRPVPVYIADYVLMDYGTGAIMAVPGEDERDWAFAEAHDLPVVRTVAPPDDFDGGAYTGEGDIINSDWLNGLSVEAAKARAIDWLVSEGIGERRVNYRLRDWGVSRQRYWGCPIPVIYCAECGAVPVPAEDLPVVLPEDVQFMGVQSPIKADPEWRKTECPKCGGPAERETDTFDTFMESSWYYARYCSPGAAAPVDDRANHWLPVDQYVGGIEHAILHLMYFRFYHKLLRDLGFLESDEPATRLLCQGMVVCETFYRDNEDGHRLWFNPADVRVERDDKGRLIRAVLEADGKPVEIGPVEKMSKSKNNGVDPQPLIDRYGADTVRLFSMFAAPPDQSLEWSDSGVEGAWRFLRRLWNEIHQFAAEGPAPDVEPDALDAAQQDIRRAVHDTIAKVDDDIGRRQTFNTAIAAVMELVNTLTRARKDGPNDRAVLGEGWRAVVQLLAPIAPHVTESLWRTLGQQAPLYAAPWPEADEDARVRTDVTVVVQVNGKLRARLSLPAGADRDAALAAAMDDENVRKFTEGQTTRKVIHVPDRLLNIVVS